MQITLCGNPLPWVDKIVHLGMTVTNKSEILEVDMNIKKARYVSRNIELNQEFHFSSSGTKIKINKVYNSSWFGSVLYSLYGAKAVKLESCYNRSIKVMMDLPYGTHRGLIEPLSERRHIRKTFARRFLVMIEKIRKSEKQILTTILSQIEQDVRSTTGHNLRMMMLQCDRSAVSEVQLADMEFLCCD